MTKQEAIQIIRDVIECYIDINHSLTSYERAEVIELIDDMENLIHPEEEVTIPGDGHNQTISPDNIEPDRFSESEENRNGF